MDSQNWYYEDHGRAKGPISTAELIAKIQKGQLTLMSLVFKDGSGAWQPIESFKEITSQITSQIAKPPPAGSPREPDWIVLRVVEVDGRERHEQIGPFTTEQVLDLIDRGRIKFNDFVWKTGFETWVPLGKLDKFDKPLASSVAVDVSLYKRPQIADLDSLKPAPVKAYKPSQKSPELKEEKPPEGASGPDLAQPAWAASLKKQNPAALQEIPEARSTRKSPEIEISKTAKATKSEVSKNASVGSDGPRLEPATSKSGKKSDGKFDKNEVVDFGEPSEIRPPSKNKKAVSETKPLSRSEAIDLREPTIIRPSSGSERSSQQRGPAVDLREPTVAVPSSGSVSAPSKSSSRLDVDERPVEKIVIRPPVAKVESTITSVPSVVTKVIKKDSPRVAPEPPKEEAPHQDVQRMKSRWNSVAVASAVFVLVVGFALMMMLGKKRLVENGDPQVAFEPPSIEVAPGGAPQSAPEDLPAPPTVPSAQETASLPPPDMGPSEAPAVAAPAPVPESPVAQTEAAEAPTKSPAALEPDRDIAKMSTKQKSFFHQDERMFVFYNSQNGLRLASNFESFLKKKNKSAATWKKSYGVWQKSVKTLNSQIAKQSNKTKVHVKLMKSLKVAAQQLESRGKEINSRMVSGRGPTKESSMDDIIAEFKKISAKAKSLDQ